MLVVNRIRFLDEIRSFDDLNLPAASAKPAEIKMAIELINQLTTDFDISKYKNTYTEALLKLIKAKARGKKLRLHI